MQPKDVRHLIVTITFCLATMVWGTIIVMRQVNDVNYHAPTKLDTYADCMQRSYPNANADVCKAIAGVK